MCFYLISIPLSYLRYRWTACFVPGTKCLAHNKDELSWSLELTGGDRTKASRAMGGSNEVDFCLGGQGWEEEEKAEFFQKQPEPSPAWVLLGRQPLRRTQFTGSLQKRKELADWQFWSPRPGHHSSWHVLDHPRDEQSLGPGWPTRREFSKPSWKSLALWTCPMRCWLSVPIWERGACE